MISRDTGCRPHEILKLRLKDITFKTAGEGQQYAEVLVNGKTGSRHIPLIDSIPYVKDWIDHHPQQETPQQQNQVGLSQVIKQIAQQVANGTGAQQAQILQTLQQIALQISNTEGGGKDKVQHTVKVIHDHVSKNPKGSFSKSMERVINYYYIESNCEFYFDPVYIHEGDVTNNFVDFGVQVAVGSPGAVQQLNQITEQVSLETGGDPAQVKGVVQNLALTNSIEGGNTQEIIDNIASEVAEPNDPVSKIIKLSCYARRER